jgi:glycosyltransferase involved in cell wall biosynthesis
MKDFQGVSIVIANYNFARFVGAAIESALAQDHPETQVIVVDDGSTDHSREVIASFGKSVRAVYQPNQGHIKACETGWALARHDIIIFLDSDDLLAPSAASTIARAWRPGISKIQWCVAVIDGGGRSIGSIFPKYPAPLEPEAVRRALLRLGNYPCPPQSANAYARWFLESCSTGDSCTPWMGGVLNPVAPLYGDIVTLHRPLTLYRVHGSNGWAYQRVNANQLRIHIAVFKEWCEPVQRCCDRMGVDFDADAALKLNFWYQQDRLVLAKMTARGSEGREPVAPLLRALLHAIRHGPDPVWQRAAIAVWAILVASLPAAWSQPLISMRCEPSQRPKWLRMFAEHIGRRRRTRGPLHSAG